MRRAGKGNISDMAALLDQTDGDGLLRDSGAGDSQTMYSNGLLCAFQENTRFQKSRRRCTSIRRVQLLEFSEA